MASTCRYINISMSTDRAEHNVLVYHGIVTSTYRYMYVTWESLHYRTNKQQFKRQRNQEQGLLVSYKAPETPKDWQVHIFTPLDVY